MCGDDSTQSYSSSCLLQSRKGPGTRIQIDQYVCMGVRPGRQVMAPPTSPRTRLLPALMLAVALVTSPIAAFGSSLSSPDSRPDRDAGGAGAFGPWPPARPNPPDSVLCYIPIRLYISFATSHLLCARSHLFSGISHLFLLYTMVYNQKLALYVTQGQVKRLYTMLYSRNLAI